ncbi:DMT family transporter [Vibrio viridaestus]|uniref:EamA family transporter n=1 Tax=Vibrio viridaestus TaxID=2487322 RepID=A0A3N9TCE5_9VIBR|nr:DMT family transporter [Vibrio viridaestus]RQW61831.1 EamA family transporter [Vibrio viridaestus]
MSGHKELRIGIQGQKYFSGIKLKSNTVALVVLITAIFIWGGNWPVMKEGLNHITPLWFSMVRFALGAATLFIVQIVAKNLYLPKKKDLPLILSIGLVQMLIFTALGSIAMTVVPAGRSAVLAYTTPLWVIPFSVLLFKEHISRRQVVGTLLGIIGVVVLFNPLVFNWNDSQALFANGLLLLASFCWSMCILHLRYTKNKVNAFQLAPWQMLVATVVLIPISYIFEGPFTGDDSTEFWHICLYLGPLATAFCFCAVNSASRALSGATMSCAMLGVPVLGLIFSTITLGESLSFNLVIGTLFIVGGICAVISTKFAK